MGSCEYGTLESLERLCYLPPIHRSELYPEAHCPRCWPKRWRLRSCGRGLTCMNAARHWSRGSCSHLHTRLRGMLVRIRAWRLRLATHGSEVALIVQTTTGCTYGRLDLLKHPMQWTRFLLPVSQKHRAQDRRVADCGLSAPILTPYASCRPITPLRRISPTPACARRAGRKLPRRGVVRHRIKSSGAPAKGRICHDAVIANPALVLTRVCRPDDFPAGSSKTRRAAPAMRPPPPRAISPRSRPASPLCSRSCPYPRLASWCTHRPSSNSFLARHQECPAMLIRRPPSRQDRFHICLYGPVLGLRHGSGFVRRAGRGHASERFLRQISRPRAGLENAPRIGRPDRGQAGTRFTPPNRARSDGRLPPGADAWPAAQSARRRPFSVLFGNSPIRA